MFGDSVISTTDFGNAEVVSKFKYGDWHLIVGDIDTNEEWVQFLKDNPHFIESYLLITKEDNQPFAFFYLLHEYDDKNIVSFHGGGWNNSLYYTLLHFRSAFLIARSLTEKGIKVRTYCKSYNEKAYRFLREVGYIKYRQVNDTIEMYFSERKMKRSKLYQKFFGTVV